MPDRTPAEELVAAADRLDALIAEAGSGPIRALNANLYPVDNTDQWLGELHSEELAAYYAAMNPDVGRTLAALLRWTAERFGPYGAPGSALDLARAILGTREDT